MSKHKATGRAERRHAAEDLALLKKELDVPLLTEAEADAMVDAAVESMSDARYRKLSKRIDELSEWVDEDWVHLSESLGEVEAIANEAHARADDALLGINDDRHFAQLDRFELIERLVMVEEFIENLRAIFSRSRTSSRGVHDHPLSPIHAHALPALPLFDESQSDNQW